MEGRSASSFYAILGVPRTFTDDQLKRQYRLLALKYHPDRNRGNEDEAAEKFKEIQEAWTTLSNPAEREAYDVELNERERHRMPRGRAQPSASGRSGSGGAPRPAGAQPTPRPRPAPDAFSRQGYHSFAGGDAAGRSREADAGRAAADRAASAVRGAQSQEQRAEQQRNERRQQYQAARERAEQAYWQEFSRTGATERPQQTRERPPSGAPPPQPGAAPPEPVPRFHGVGARVAAEGPVPAGARPTQRASAPAQPPPQQRPPGPPPRPPQARPPRAPSGAAAAEAAAGFTPATPMAEWDGMEAALAASLQEETARQEEARRAADQEEAAAVRAVEEQLAREAEEIEEALRLVEQFKQMEQDAMDAQAALDMAAAAAAETEAELASPRRGSSDDELLRAAGGADAPADAPYERPWSGLSPQNVANQPSPTSGAAPAVGRPVGRDELAERQLAALMEMGYHAEQAAPFCDGETPLELLVEQIDAAEREAGGGDPFAPASNDPFPPELVPGLARSRGSSSRLPKVTAGGLRSAAQKALSGVKQAAKSRPSSAR